jgi:hypothetical protein
MTGTVFGTPADRTAKPAPDVPTNPAPSNQPQNSVLSNDIPVLLILSVVGAIGGYLSEIQNRAARSDGSKRRSKETYFHMMQGAAGAIIIVTLSPVDPQIVNGLFGATPQAFIKLIALALIGGYAGGSLLESSASQYAKRIDKIEEKQKILEEEAEKERDVVRSAEQILRGYGLSSSDIQEFQRELKEISSSKRWEIAYKADENHRQHWEKDKEPMERSLLIFQALVKTDEAETVHWWYGSLGYCLKDKRNPDYAEAAERLDTAIKIRGPETRSGAYEFNRAFCNIQLERAHGLPRTEYRA